MSALVVRKVMGLALVQDLGRAGFASQGVPRGGALVRSALARANAAVGNDAGAAAIELSGRLVVAAESELVVATERGDRRVLSPGAELAVEPDASRRVRYLAVAGGVDVPPVLGSRSTLRVAGLGGFEGRALRAGDRLLVGEEDEGGVYEPGMGMGNEGDPVRLVVGPDLDSFGEAGVESLMGQGWRVGSQSDRTGTRLEGLPIPRAPGFADALSSSPMAVGAIQVPASGLPIVLGPDGPTTGGYPLIGVIAAADLDRFHALPLGAEVRFALFS
ncbi:MAG TPA: biotin-dependent carboxyltransferase family protein [Polyangiaceae bacterium]|nr:biotin-dependent carboxyltransferase family protein [Polyangiaceae bacterium]